MKSIENELDLPELEYLLNTSLKHQKKFSQFFTPHNISNLMCNWLLENKNLKKVLEPAFGLGVFSRILLKEKPSLIINGFEIDNNILKESLSLFSNKSNLQINLKDYIFSDWKNKYDGIICNPPYSIFKDYNNKLVLSEIEKKMNFKFNGSTNLALFFLLKSIFQLNTNGRSAYIIPSDFFNSAYGISVKKYLLESNTLRHIFIIDFKENIFRDVVTTASILFFAKDKNFEKVHFSKINSKDDLKKISDFIKKYPNSNGDYSYKSKFMIPDYKWSKYYKSQGSDKYNNLVPFSNFAKVLRGIATGANDYFIFNLSKAKEFSLNVNNLLPCICKSRSVKNLIFTNDDFIDIKNKDESVFLFNGLSSNSFPVRNYIKIGESKKVNEKYLTKNRMPWYRLEKRLPSPIWVSVFNRNGLKFIRNEANVSNLTTFHSIYLSNNPLYEVEIDLFFSYLITDVAKEIFDDNRREYGNGLKKFEPNDFNKGLVLDLTKLSKVSKKKVLSIYNDFKKLNDISLIKEIDSIFRKEYLKNISVNTD